MSTQYAIGTLCTNSGQEIPLSTSITDESTSAEVKTDSVFCVTQQSIGDYAPGQTITHGIVTAKTGIAWAYIVRQGLVASVIPIASRTAGGNGSNNSPTILLAPFTLMPGDKLLTYSYV